MDNFLSNEIDISTLQPPTVKNLKEFEEIANVENKNLNKIRLEIIDIFNNRFVHLANEQGIARWEKMLKIQRRRTDTLEERRQRVLLKINQRLPYTIRTLKQLLDLTVGHGLYEILLDLDNFEMFFEFYTNLKKRDELVGILEEMLPLNIIFHLIRTLSVELYLKDDSYHYPVHYKETGEFSGEKDFSQHDLGSVDVTSDTYSYEVEYPVSEKFVTIADGKSTELVNDTYNYPKRFYAAGELETLTKHTSQQSAISNIQQDCYNYAKIFPVCGDFYAEME